MLGCSELFPDAVAVGCKRFQRVRRQVGMLSNARDQMALLAILCALSSIISCVNAQTTTNGIQFPIPGDSGVQQEAGGTLFPSPPAAMPPPPPQTFAAAENESAVVDISCSIISWGYPDWKFGLTPDGWTNRCIEGVKLAKSRCSGKAINFVPTHFWLDLFDDNSVVNYCDKVNHGTDWDPIVCDPMNDTLIDAFEIGYKYCLLEAAKQGFKEIHILPHVDDGHQMGGWRNALKLDPFMKSDGHSYVDIMIAPLARGLQQVVAQYPNIKVGFALQGEMSFAVLVYPSKWMQLYDGVKYFIANGSRDVMDRIHVGVSFNSNKLCGVMTCQQLQQSANSKYIPNPQSPNGTAIQNATVPMPHLDPVAVGKMFNKTDFMGISAYPVIWNVGDDLTIDVGPNSKLAGPLGSFNAELMDDFNYGLTDLFRWRPNIEFHFSEFSVGGGGDVPQQPVATAALAFRTPYNGVSGLYSVTKDPWQRPDMARMRYMFWKQVIDWLDTGNPNAQYPISHLFMWNIASWDPAALYWAATNRADGTSYYAPGIMDCIRAWNDERQLCEWLPLQADYPQG